MAANGDLAGGASLLPASPRAASLPMATDLDDGSQGAGQRSLRQLQEDGPPTKGCACKYIEYYTTANQEQIVSANKIAMKCLGVFSLIGHDRLGEPVYKHTTHVHLYSFSTPGLSRRCAHTPNSTFALVTGVKGCGCPASVCPQVGNRQYVWRKFVGWDPSLNVFVRCALGPTRLSACTLNGSCTQLIEPAITVGRTDHASKPPRELHEPQPEPTVITAAFGSLDVRIRQFASPVASPWLKALSLDDTHFFTFRAMNPTFYRGGMVLRYSNAHMCMADKVYAPYRTSM